MRRLGYDLGFPFSLSLMPDASRSRRVACLLRVYLPVFAGPRQRATAPFPFS